MKQCIGIQNYERGLFRKHIEKISTHKRICEQAQKLVSDGQEPIVIRSKINRSGISGVQWM